MKKESGGKYSLGGDDYGKMMEEKMRLKKHRIALRKAKSNRPGKKI